MALAVGGGAHRHGGRAVGVDLHGGVLFLTGRRGDLHIARQTDAQPHGVASGSTGGLFGSQFLVTNQIAGPVQRLLVLAGVIRPAGGRHQWKVLRGQEVTAAELHRVDTQLGRREIGHALDGEGGLGPSCPPERPQRGPVGGGEAVVELHLLDAVNPGGHDPSDGGEDSAQSGIGPGVHQRHHLQRHHASVVGHPQAGVVDLVAGLHGDEVLGPGLRPHHRATELPSGRGRRHMLHSPSPLGPEAAAHPRGNHPHLIRVQAQRLGDASSGGMGTLGGHPQGELVPRGIGQHRVGFHRHHRHSVVDDAAGDDLVGFVVQALHRVERPNHRV